MNELAQPENGGEKTLRWANVSKNHLLSLPAMRQ